MAKRWYIVHAYSNFERKVAEAIKERAQQQGLSELFDEVLVPTEEVVEVRRGRKVASERKFFPGYVLVKMELTDQAYHLIKNTPKVTGFLGAENKPMPISEDEAKRILNQVQEGVERPKPTISFEIGEQVRVADGPFASFSGLVEEIDEERARLKVAVSIFGRATPVELEFAQVEKAS
ncbi:MAG: transcription termination/antitermination protein NusG [Hyphomicrobiaceae bacterium]